MYSQLNILYIYAIRLTAHIFHPQKLILDRIVQKNSLWIAPQAACMISLFFDNSDMHFVQLLLLYR